MRRLFGPPEPEGPHSATTLAGSIGVLPKFAQTFDEYVPFLRVNLDEYMWEIERKQRVAIDVGQVNQLAAEHFAQQKAIAKRIPEKVNLGVFSVSCSGVSRLLSEKHGELASRLLDLLASLTGELASGIATEYQEIHDRLSQAPENIEDLTALREFMDGVPEKTESLQKRISDMTTYHQALDGFCYKLERKDFNEKWTVFGWPHRLASYMEEIDDLLDEKKEEYAKDMENEQQVSNSHLARLLRCEQDTHRHVAGIRSDTRCSCDRCAITRGLHGRKAALAGCRARRRYSKADRKGERGCGALSVTGGAVRKGCFGVFPAREAKEGVRAVQSALVDR